MSDSKLTLPGAFKAGMRYLLEGGTLLAWQRNLQADRAIAGPGISESQGPNGRVFSVDVTAVTAATTAGAFYGLRTVSSAGADNGDIYLQGGQVAGGDGNETVDEYLLYDASADAWAGSAGDHLQLSVSGSGEATSGILDPTFNVGSASLSVVSSLGGNTMPSSGSLSGKNCRVSLGVFSDDGFAPAGAGNVQIGFCWGGYNISRF